MAKRLFGTTTSLIRDVMQEMDPTGFLIQEEHQVVIEELRSTSPLLKYSQIFGMATEEKIKHNISQFKPEGYTIDGFYNLAKKLLFAVDMKYNDTEIKFTEDDSFIMVIIHNKSAHTQDINVIYNKTSGVAIKTKILENTNSGTFHLMQEIFSPQDGNTLFTRNSHVTAEGTTAYESDINDTFYAKDNISLFSKCLIVYKDKEFVVITPYHKDYETASRKATADVIPMDLVEVVKEEDYTEMLFKILNKFF